MKGHLISPYFSEEVMAWSAAVHKTLPDQLIFFLWNGVKRGGKKKKQFMYGRISSWVVSLALSALMQVNLVLSVNSRIEKIGVLLAITG